MDDKKNKSCIGIVGPIAAGKGVAGYYLMNKYGFVSFSLSSIIHEEIRNRGIKTFTRSTLQDIGNDLRRRYGNQVLAERAIKTIHFNGLSRIIIEGIRNPGEVRYLKKLPNFILIAIKAKKEVRFERIKTRAKPWDPKTLDEFIEMDRRDLGYHEAELGQQVGECIKMADYIITNNEDWESFYKKIDKVAKKIL
jgi:dephospho-CoA kinase